MSEIRLTQGKRQRNGDLSAAKRHQHQARKGRTGPRGTGRYPSSTQTAELAAKMLTKAINPFVPRSGRPISWDQTRISSPASCSADAQAQLSYDAEQYRGKRDMFLKYSVLVGLPSKTV